LLLAPGSADTDYEFLELRNISNSVISLNGVEISGGIEFQFSNGSITSLQPGAYVLVVSNLPAFQARYGPGLPVAGEYSGQLSNGGEYLLVSDAARQPINEFTFDDVPPWPTAADGGGPSMEVVNLAGDYSSGTNWRASVTLGGNPGRAATFPGDFDANGAVDGADFLAWQRGFGGAYTAGDLPVWRANFGSEFATAVILGAASSPLSAGKVTIASVEVERPLENARSVNAVSADASGMPALDRGQRWYFPVSLGLEASKLSSTAGDLSTAIDAAFANWTPQHRSGTDKRMSEMTTYEFGAGGNPTTAERQYDVPQGVLVHDQLRLNVYDEILTASELRPLLETPTRVRPK
jgi:hypothetical protein